MLCPSPGGDSTSNFFPSYVDHHLMSVSSGHVCFKIIPAKHPNREGSLKSGEELGRSWIGIPLGDTNRRHHSERQLGDTTRRHHSVTRLGDTTRRHD